MSSSPEVRAWCPTLDLTPVGLSPFDPARINEAIDRGYEAGYRAGEAAAAEARRASDEAAIAELRARAAVLLDELRGATSALTDRTAQLADQFADAVAPAAMRLAEAIVQIELSEPTRAAEVAMRRALAEVGSTGPVVLRMHPSDVDLLEGDGLAPGLDLQRDATLAPGDAVAVVGDTTVDARVDAAIDRARAALGLQS